MDRLDHFEGADVFFRSPDPEYRWLVPGLLERGDRLLITGNEGKGKSTFLRQLAVQIAAGIHPFSLQSIQPRKVLVIDLENSHNQIRRKLVETCDPSIVDSGFLSIASWPSGVDLMHADYITAMTAVIARFQPEVLIVGPMYKMGGHLEKEEDSNRLAMLLDLWRTAHGFALFMESHQPHQVVTQTTKFRPERPFGSSLWLRWPEFGICLEDDGRLRHWRGARELDRAWPDKLRWGDTWPWVVDNRCCMVCGTPLNTRQEKYCSEKCGTAGRVRNHRAAKRLL